MAPVTPTRSGASLAPFSEPAPPLPSGSRTPAVSEAAHRQHIPSLPHPSRSGPSAQQIFLRPGFRRESVGSRTGNDSFRTARSHSGRSSIAGSARSRSHPDDERESIAASHHEGNRPSYWPSLFGNRTQHQRTTGRPNQFHRASLRIDSARSDRRADAKATPLGRNQNQSTQAPKASKTAHNALRGFMPSAKAVWYVVDTMAYATIGLTAGVAMVGLFPFINVAAIPVAMAGGACAAAAYFGASKYLRHGVFGDKISSS